MIIRCCFAAVDPHSAATMNEFSVLAFRCGSRPNVSCVAHQFQVPQYGVIPTPPLMFPIYFAMWIPESYPFLRYAVNMSETGEPFSISDVLKPASLFSYLSVMFYAPLLLASEALPILEPNSVLRLVRSILYESLLPRNVLIRPFQSAICYYLAKMIQAKSTI